VIKGHIEHGSFRARRNSCSKSYGKASTSVS
jgi:hypothetical protein